MPVVSNVICHVAEGVAYDDENGGYNLADDRSSEFRALDNICGRLGQHNNTLAEDDQGQKTAPLIQVGMLETDGCPLAAGDEDGECLQHKYNVPSNVERTGRRLLEREGETETYSSTDHKRSNMDQKRSGDLLVILDPGKERSILNHEDDSADDQDHAELAECANIPIDTVRFEIHTNCSKCYHDAKVDNFAHTLEYGVNAKADVVEHDL